MLRRLRTIVLVLLFAVIGAALGRVAAEVRRRQEAGEDPADVDLRQVRIRPADLVPGLVAAVRVRDQPWSWLHIPSWLAAFAVNLAVAAAGGDFSRLREMAERYAFSMAGIELPRDEDESGGHGVYETYEPPRYASTAYAPQSDPDATDAEPSDAREGTTWTVPGGQTDQPRDAGPRDAGPRDAGPWEAGRERPGGFTPFRD